MEAYQCSASLPNSLQGPPQAVDYFDGHDVRGSGRVLSRGQVPGHDRVEVQGVPQPAGQPDVAEAARVGPAHRTQADAHDIGVIGERDRVVLGKEAQLSGLPLSVVEDDGALPTSFLVVVEFPEIGNDLLARPGVRCTCSRPRHSTYAACRLWSWCSGGETWPAP